MIRKQITAVVNSIGISYAHGMDRYTFLSPEQELTLLLDRWAIFFSDLPTPFASLAPRSYTVVFNSRMRSRAGLCRPALGKIEINPNLVKTTDFLEDILVHEMAHLSVSRRWPRAPSHGERWQKLMRLCGKNPQRCHSAIPERRFTQKRWDMICACGPHRVTTVIFNRIQKGIRYKCKSCDQLLLT